MLALLWIASALGGSLRATLEVGPDGPVLIAATPIAGDVRAAPGPLEVRDASGAVLATAAWPDPRIRSIVLPDGGGLAAQLVSGRIAVTVPWPDGADALWIDGRALRTAAPPAPPPPFETTLVQQSGPSESRLDLVFVADGYTAAQLPEFAEDVDWIVAYLLGIEPYGQYTGLFNIWRVDVASTESGGSHPELGQPAKNTAFGCAYDCAGIDRLICCNDSVVMDTVDAAVPGAEGVLVLVNDDVYGGSGGFNYAVSYVGADNGRQVAAHELGHSLIGLWDEYGYGFSSTGEGPNCTEDGDPPWTEWLGTDGVDAFQECSYTAHYRPTENQCMMRSLQDDYCPVCRQETVLAIYGKLPDLVQSTTPEVGTALDGSTAVSVDAIGPDAGLTYTWTVGEDVVGEKPTFDPKCSDLHGELWLTVRDDTFMVRSDPDGLLEQTVGPWPIDVGPCADEVLPLDCACDHGGAPPLALAPLLLIGLRRRRDQPGSTASAAASNAGRK